MNISERFINYTKINTTTNPEKGSLGIMPSSDGQWILANKLKDELESLNGVSNIELKENGILTAEIPSNTSKKVPTIAFFAHLDTSSEHTNDTNASLIDYLGGDIQLKNGLSIRVLENPELKNYIGDKIFVTDGTSLLGADDKAAIAAIMEMLEYFSKNTEEKHGTIRVAFLPDEEQGLLGAKAFKSPNFADFGYTLDCCGIGEFVCENWNAGNAVVEFVGQSAHPMNSKGNLKNSILIAQKFMQLFPSTETPEVTEGKEGYYWMKKMSGNSAKTLLNIDIRDFSVQGYEKRKQFIRDAVHSFKLLYGQETIKLSISDRYKNVASFLNESDGSSTPVSLALEAYRENNIKPKLIPMRGGYDGAVLSEFGIPCPNIFTGAHNFHSIYEYLPLKSLISASSVIKSIVKNNARAK
ncbi:peptidase T [Vibrio owensii]|uniref:Peptidase T n=1 Tax=Vibrio owensii CAIM 1854 = LMG 25443 TaxID=1229493 RepID=A0A0C1VW90_9VIBR|nr:peptidase T [Vibrio owensii]KIF54358.1 peptidase M20 [Vibrio owensii CAIM 1854 = LMG 25443]